MKIENTNKLTLNNRKLTEDVNEGEWKLVDTKTVEDVDGFITDYSWWSKGDDQHIFIFGDTDLYTPETAEPDWECDSQKEAQEWFDSYNGFEEDEEIFDEGYISNSDKKYTYDELKELDIELDNYLRDEGLSPDELRFDNSENKIADLQLYVIIDGDWKHDHLATEYAVNDFVENKGFVVLKHEEQEIGDSQSDWFKAAHKWFLVKDEHNDKQKLINQINGLKALFNGRQTESLELNEEMKRFHFEYTVDGVKSEQTISANNMQDAEALIKKQYTDKSVSITKREEIKESLEEICESSTEDLSEQPPETPEDTGVAGVISGLIQDEWEAIDGYNSALATIKDLNDDKSEMIAVLSDIVAEENRHVGQLQELLKLVSPNAEQINDGEKEAKEQIDDAIEVGTQAEVDFDADDDIDENNVFTSDAVFEALKQNFAQPVAIVKDPVATNHTAPQTINEQTEMNLDDVTTDDITTLSDDDIDDTI